MPPDTEPRTREQLVAALAEIAQPGSLDIAYWPVSISPAEAAQLVEWLEPARTPAFEGWADIELMGHRSRIAYVREIELAHSGFFELAWNEMGIDQREIYSPTAVFSITPLENEQQADELRARRHGGVFAGHSDDRHDDVPF